MSVCVCDLWWVVVAGCEGRVWWQGVKAGCEGRVWWQATLTIFTAITLEGWTDTMYQLMDAVRASTSTLTLILDFDP